MSPAHVFDRAGGVARTPARSPRSQGASTHRNVAKAGRILRAAPDGKRSGAKSSAAHGWIDPMHGLVPVGARQEAASRGDRRRAPIRPRAHDSLRICRAGRRASQNATTGAPLGAPVAERSGGTQAGWPPDSNRKPSRLGIVTDAPLAGFDRRQGRSERARIASEGRSRRMRPSSPTSSIARNP